MKKDDRYGEGDARVSPPDGPQRDNKGKGSLGAGKESTGGIAKDGKGNVDQSRSGVTPGVAPDAGPDKGSGYGGNKGGPKTSSDQR